jgi:hypothetical protein
VNDSSPQRHQGIIAIDVQQNLWYWTTIWIMKADGPADAVVGGLPGAYVVVDVPQRPELFPGQRPDRLEPRHRPYPGVQPWEVLAGHDQFGEQFLTLHQPPHLLTMIHKDKSSPDEPPWCIPQTERITRGIDTLGLACPSRCGPLAVAVLPSLKVLPLRQLIPQPGACLPG